MLVTLARCCSWRDRANAFKRYTWKLKRGRETLLRHKDDGDMSFMSAEENELFDTVQRTAPRCRCTIALPMTAPDVSDDRTAYPSMLFARAHLLTKRPPLPAIYRAIRTAIRDGRTAPMTRPGLASSSQAPTCRAGVKIACTARTLATLSRCIPLAYRKEGRNHILFEYSDAPCLPWHAEHAIVAKVGLSEFHHRNGLGVSMPLFSMVTFIHSHRSDAFRPHKQKVPRHLQRHQPSLLVLGAMCNHLPKLHNGRGIVWVYACRWFGEERMGREGKGGYDPSCKQAEEEFNKYMYTELALETKFGLIVEAFGYHPFRSWLRVPSPSLSSITTCCPTRTCWTGRRSASAFPSTGSSSFRGSCGRSLMRWWRRCRDPLCLCLRSSSSPSVPKCTQDHPVQRRQRVAEGLEPAAVTPPPPSTNHHCSGGMNRRALPCDDHPATLVRLWKQQHQHTPQSKRAMNNQLLIFPSLSRPPWRPSQQQQQQPTHPPPPM
ncbi:hypothetical protein PTSG_11217 [Salpingoeca rosetta]|uniref:Uncharacterized protein n=1 Tax=Salpingoeca rosetta (strain ATCC 50818 / BSB-021) TaxID=946362 RepID=F2USR8_SALR5|nr:uncharacterized protein PTSG_11217 [Salpingoeca rosetta]EGD81177.1 hypothetical protein PTSG_11217 [Salpingoeca rosetta]|eukprot:XP_004987862.1 hypothetical protein PTSG_11217 [Salpingoeca rosetta]